MGSCKGSTPLSLRQKNFVNLASEFKFLPREPILSYTYLGRCTAEKSVMCLHVPYFDDGFAFPRVFVFLFVSVVFSTFFSTSSILARHKDVLPVVQRHPLHRSWRVYCVLSYYFCLPSRYRGVLLFPGPRHRRRLSCPSLLTCFPLFL